MTPNFSLSVYDRMTLMGILPAQVGSFDEMIAVSALRKRFDLSDAEKEACGFRVSDMGHPEWIPNKVDEAEFVLSESDLDLIGKGLKLMETRGNIPTDLLFVGFYEKFAPHVNAAPDSTG